MSINKVNPYNIEPHTAEIYDNIETQTYDVEFIINLLKKYGCKNVLEPFCGTGRILIPIAKNNFKITGIDNSEMMINCLDSKIENIPIEIRNNIKIIQGDVTNLDWLSNYDAVILGGNCFFELASLEGQESVLYKAYGAVNNNGYIFIDNDNIENQLPDSWCELNVENKKSTRKCQDGTELKGFSMPVFVDKKNKIWKAKRRLEVYKDNKIVNQYEWEIQKHPIGYSEIIKMLKKLELKIINIWAGTKNIQEYHEGATRATFWVQK